MFALLSRLAVVASAALMGYAVGWVSNALVHLLPQPANYPFLVEYIPLPHHVPEHEGGVSFRFAMAHDVIHERFAKHGPAHYRERNRLTREALAKLTSEDPRTFPLADDLGAGLDRLGNADEAVPILRDKLARQQAAGLVGRDLYTSYANLGTFLTHASFPMAITGDRPARERFREGLSLVRRSVEVNPQAHFGRERWQVVVGEFFLASMDRPSLLKTFDFLGNRLDLGTEAILDREQHAGTDRSYSRSADSNFNRGDAHPLPAFFESGVVSDDPARSAELSLLRNRITKIGAEDGWEKVTVPSHRTPVPFDEPILGIIGIWRQGSGANPHFALALGETMLRVGQRYIAWAAFERAARMATRFSPDPDLQRFLRDHCRRRQGQIEETLTFQAPVARRRPSWQHISPPPSKETVADLRPSFEAELAHGEGYQRAYQEYEAKKIAAGVSITDERFFDEFHADREPIASPVGLEDTFALVPPAKMQAYAAQRRQSWGVFGAGVAAMLTALLLGWRDRRRRIQGVVSPCSPSAPLPASISES